MLHLYTVATLNLEPIGRNAVEFEDSKHNYKVYNYDVTKVAGGHTDYRSNLKKILKE